MTLDQAAALSRYWRQSPPAHELLAAQLGWRDPGPERAPAGAPVGVTDDDRARLAALEAKWGLA